MKTYFTGLLILMLGFTAFVFFKRPGALAEFMSAGSGKIDFNIPKIKSSTSRSKSKTSSKQFPYFSFVSGDVLLNTEAQSYLVQPNIEIRKQDKIMVSFHSYAIIALGPEKYLRLGEGTKLSYLKKPRRRRGFYEFKLEKGELFSDFFASKDPIGLKIHIDQSSVSFQDSTFRLIAKADGDFISSVDRGKVQFYKPSTSQVFKVEAGIGAKSENGAITVSEFDWVDDYPWEQRINNITSTGHGKPPTFKATPLSKRPAAVDKEQMAVSWKKTNRAQVRRRPSKSIGKVTNILKTVGNKATAGIKNVIAAPGKISESKESIQNFEEIQKQRAKALDAIE